MGLDRTVHIEPFIKIPVQYREYNEEIKTCGEHTNYNNDKYCPKCGKEIKKEIITKKAMVWVSDLIGDDSLWQYVEGEYMYLFSNQYLNTRLNTEENKIGTITPEIMNVMIEEFKTLHKERIKTLEQKLNIPIVVEFGYLYHIS